jgi:hypothetical protein
MVGSFGWHLPLFFRGLFGRIGSSTAWPSMGLILLDAPLVHPRRVPELLRDAKRVDAGGLPPSLFIADPMDLTVVHASDAERNGSRREDDALVEGDRSTRLAIPRPY